MNEKNNALKLSANELKNVRAGLEGVTCKNYCASTGYCGVQTGVKCPHGGDLSLCSGGAPE